MNKTLTGRAPAIECDGCASAIKRSLGRLAGVESVHVNVATQGVTVRYDDAQTTPLAITDVLEHAGFPLEAAA